MKKLFSTYCVLFLIMIMAAFFRLYGLNWDQGHHLHPDERFLTMVAGAIKWPDSVLEYFDQAASPLNPYNAGFNFFVYGTFPLYFVKLLSSFIKFDALDYNNITLVGRFVSASFDLGTVGLLFFIGRRLFNTKVGLFASFFYALSVLPIQLSHFFAVDTFLVFFVVLSFYFLILLFKRQKPYLPALLLGASFGLALASKISTLLFLPIIVLGFGFHFMRFKSFRVSSLLITIFLTFSYLTLRIVDPRVFQDSSFFDLTINPLFVSNLTQLQSFNNPEVFYPPAVQWITTTPIVFPFRNMVLWGLGIPLGTLVVFGVFYSLLVVKSEIFSLLQIGFTNLTSFKTQQHGIFLILVWILFLFFYQGIQFVKGLRYFYPIYPFLSLVAAFFFYDVFWNRVKNRNIKSVVFILFLIYPVSFISIYSQPHSRVSASEWIYENIPRGSTISCEHWDDCLPLPIDEKSSALYKTELLTLFDPDTEEKWYKINSQLEKVDYLILSSNRLWGSIPKVPQKYPITSQFYNDLFTDKLHFTKVAEINSFPTIPLLNISLNDSLADESFTVYDHPQVIIFKKNI